MEFILSKSIQSPHRASQENKQQTGTTTNLKNKQTNKQKVITGQRSSVPVFQSRIWKGASLGKSVSSPRRGGDEVSPVPSAQRCAGEGLGAGVSLERGLNVPECSTQSKHTADRLPPAPALFPFCTLPSHPTPAPSDTSHLFLPASFLCWSYGSWMRWPL